MKFIFFSVFVSFLSVVHSHCPDTLICSNPSWECADTDGSFCRQVHGCCDPSHCAMSCGVKGTDCVSYCTNLDLSTVQSALPHLNFIAPADKPPTVSGVHAIAQSLKTVSNIIEQCSAVLLSDTPGLGAVIGKVFKSYDTDPNFLLHALRAVRALKNVKLLSDFDESHLAVCFQAYETFESFRKAKRVIVQSQLDALLVSSHDKQQSKEL